MKALDETIFDAQLHMRTLDIDYIFSSCLEHNSSITADIFRYAISYLAENTDNCIAFVTFFEQLPFYKIDSIMQTQGTYLMNHLANILKNHPHLIYCCIRLINYNRLITMIIKHAIHAQCSTRRGGGSLLF